MTDIGVSAVFDGGHAELRRIASVVNQANLTPRFRAADEGRADKMVPTREADSAGAAYPIIAQEVRCGVGS